MNLSNGRHPEGTRGRAPELGITYDEHHVFGQHRYRYATIAFARPISALTFCEAMGWQRPYALSTDVHQTRWTIQLWVADLADPYGPRIHTRFPTLGAWAVIPQLSGRPQGTRRFYCPKHTLFCESQHRALPSLRRRALDRQVELHPAAAAERGSRPGDWVSVETPEGSIRGRAVLNDSLEPRVACGQHGWWRACPDIGAPGYDPFGPNGANLNLIIGNLVIDPISGSVLHRAYLCQIRRRCWSVVRSKRIATRRP